MTKAVPED